MPNGLDVMRMQEAVRAARVEWQRHALERMAERGIRRADALEALHSGDKIEEKAMREHGNASCPLCRGRKQPGTTTFTADLGFGVIVARDVPATVCSQCGTDWISDDVASRLEALVEEAKAKRLQVEVMSLA